MFRLARWALPVLALVGLVGTACTPVKQQFGKNILAFSITNSCLPGLPLNQPTNGFRSPSNNFSRQVCDNGVASHSVGANGVTLQVANGEGVAPPGQFAGASVGFATGGINSLGALNAIQINLTPGSSVVGISLIIDKNGDGQFLAPPNAQGQGTGFGGDAIAVANRVINGNDGGQYVYLNADTFSVLFEPNTGAPFFFFKPGPDGGGATSLANLKAGFHPGIDGNTRAVIFVSTFNTTDARATVTGVDVNGTQFLP